MRFVVPVIALLTIIQNGCGHDGVDVDLKKFEEIPELDFSAISIAGDAGYWELRDALILYQSDFTVIGKNGSLCHEAADPNRCNSDFLALSPDTGFTPHGHPLGSVYYIAANKGDDNWVIVTLEEAKQFIGELESEQEAALWALVNGYHWTSEKVNGAIRKVAEGFELIVIQTVRWCDPIQVNRFHILITADGTVEQLGQEVFLREVGCA